MNRTLLKLCRTMVVAALLTWPPPAGAVPLNPHQRPEPCLSCHTRPPSAAEAAAARYFLIKGSIDDTCKTCHSCCRVGRLHLETGHPSDTSDWDRSRFTTPKTLPLHDGKITCNTCHFHRVPDAPTVHMLRMVKMDDRFGVDWSALCRDCHVGY